MSEVALKAWLAQSEARVKGRNCTCTKQHPMATLDLVSDSFYTK